MTHLHLAVDLTGAGAHPAAWRTLDPEQRRSVVDTLAAHLDAVGPRRLRPRAARRLAHAGPGRRPHRARHARRRPGRRPASRRSRRASVWSRPSTPPTPSRSTSPRRCRRSTTSAAAAAAGRSPGRRRRRRAAAFGRKAVQDEADAVDEAREVVGVVRDLWDSWEDDAEIRDAATSRFVDRDKLHYVDHVGERFSVKGPSITPRSPQGQLPVVVRVASPESVVLAGRVADVVRIEARGVDRAAELVARVRAAAAEAGRDPAGRARARRRRRRARCRRRCGPRPPRPARRARGRRRSRRRRCCTSVTPRASSTSSPAGRRSSTGFTVRPASAARRPARCSPTRCCPRCARPAWSATPTPPDRTTLRDSLGLPRPASRLRRRPRCPTAS